MIRFCYDSKMDEKTQKIYIILIIITIILTGIGFYLGWLDKTPNFFLVYF